MISDAVFRRADRGSIDCHTPRGYDEFRQHQFDRHAGRRSQSPDVAFQSGNDAGIYQALAVCVGELSGKSRTEIRQGFQRENIRSYPDVPIFYRSAIRTKNSRSRQKQL